MVNFQNSVTKIFTASWIEVVVLKCRKKIFGRKIAEIVRYLPDQNILAMVDAGGNCHFRRTQSSSRLAWSEG